ncbi:OB-fold protein [Citrobacter portucalensis]|uniref:OB-fold protein n=1 Tax=Citrobacter portucalensis TaxID=1639133 RepID=UPI00224344D6|nr:hypothetical protein [Citrobacter portucalensis]MCW8352047.1 OB-fold putative lipoprotein [Citrobacter portucalensis]MCX9054113.1 OB-fold putative lipoprotein [Citrobacter portucalensis]
MKKIICGIALACLTVNSAIAEQAATVKDPTYGNLINTLADDEYQIFMSGGETLIIGYGVTDPLSASQLITMYEKNELAANKKLKDKLVRIKSVATEIGENAMGQAYVRADGKNQFQNVTLFVDGNDERILDMAKGSKIDFLCKMDKYVMRTPFLKECVFTSDVAKKRKDAFLEGLTSEQIAFRYQAYFLSLYQSNKSEVIKYCSKTGKECLNGVAKIFNDEKKQKELQKATNELIGDKKLPPLPF